MTPTPDVPAKPVASGTPVPEPTVRVTAYSVSCVPEDNINAPHFTAKVEYRGRGGWAVTDGFHVYAADGSRAHEHIPTERTDEFLARFRHSELEAVSLAKRVAPTLRVNGYTVADVLARADR